MVMKKTLAATECWQKDIKNKKKQTNKKQSKKKQKPKKEQNKVFFTGFSRFVTNVLCTQNLTTVSQKKKHSKKKT